MTVRLTALGDALSSNGFHPTLVVVPPVAKGTSLVWGHIQSTTGVILYACRCQLPYTVFIPTALTHTCYPCAPLHATCMVGFVHPLYPNTQLPQWHCACHSHSTAAQQNSNTPHCCMPPLTHLVQAAVASMHAHASHNHSSLHASTHHTHEQQHHLLAAEAAPLGEHVGGGPCSAFYIHMGPYGPMGP
jgi:hypothetical protein